jgi:hypothetical protein
VSRRPIKSRGLPSLAVTDMTFEEDTEPAVLYKGYLSTIDEAIEHVKAADTLGLGFRVESYMVSSTESGEEPGQHGEFEFTLFGDLPVRQETEEFQPEPEE